MASGRKKLLVLDINGFLVDAYRHGELLPKRPYDGKVNRFIVYARPFCDSFLSFCLENFLVGVWSSARKNNVHALVDFIFKEAKQKLAFIWHQEHCTDTGFRHPDNPYKPIFLKELWNLWQKSLPDVPWEAGDYGPTNTLLIDDSSYKAIKNPPYTAIFPTTYKATGLDRKDSYLGVKLQTYLEGLLQERDVQVYLRQNPLGDPSNAMGDDRWSSIFLALKPRNEGRQLVAAHSKQTEQSAVHNIPQSQSVARIKDDKKTLETIINQEENSEQKGREEDGNNLQISLQNLCLQESPAGGK